MKFEGFDVLRSLGMGATSEVFEAINLKTQKRVALKAFSSLIQSDPEIVARLESEVDILHKIQHPNIVTLLSHHRSKEAFVLELELVDGSDLRKWAKDLDVALIEPRLWVLAQIARGLGAAHEIGIIHRDLKPENILVSKDGEVKITDFGLARQINRLTITRLGLLIGSLGYMAPELINGGRANEKADLFSFGVIAYEVLCGRPPFEGETPQAVIKQITDGEIKPIRSINPLIPENIARVVESCLSKDPSLRPQSVWFLEAELMTRLSTSGLLADSKNLVSTNHRTTVLVQALRLKHSTLKSQIEKSKTTGSRKETLTLVTEMMALFPDEEGMSAMLGEMQETREKRATHRLAVFVLTLILFLGAGAWIFFQEPVSKPSATVAETELQPRSLTGATNVRDVLIEPKTDVAVSNLPKAVARPKPVQFGSIKFDVDPDVEIFVNGGVVPKSQWEHYPIVVGRHRVRMAKSGFVPIDSEVNVTPGKVALIRARGNP